MRSIHSYAEAEAEYARLLPQAEALGMAWHWLIACMGLLLGCAIENPNAMINSPGTLVAVPLLALLGIPVSRFIALPLVPWPYAWLARHL